MTIDVHTHLAGGDALPDAFFAGWAQNIRRLLPSELPERLKERVAERYRLEPDQTGDAHVARMDAAGIEVSVSLIIDFGFAFGPPTQVPRPPGDADPGGEAPPLEPLYAAHRAMAERHPGRFLVFAGVDPRRGAAGVELVERALRDWGFRGVKLYPPCGYSPSDRRLDPIYALCGEHRVPVLTHTGPTTPALSFHHTRPTDIDEAARRFPTVNFILAHGAVVHCEDAALLAEYRPNVHVDTAGFQVAVRRGEWAETLALYKRRGLCRKLLFGTDAPLHSQHGTLADAIAALRDGPLNPGELRQVLHDNAKELLRIP